MYILQHNINLSGAEQSCTVNTWVAETKADDTELVFVGEGLLSITETIDPAKMQFGYEDFVFVENLYGEILNDAEVTSWLNETMLLEVDTMSVEDVEAHIANVKSIVEEYKSVVVG